MRGILKYLRGIELKPTKGDDLGTDLEEDYSQLILAFQADAHKGLASASYRRGT